MVQWLRLHASIAGDLGLIPGQGTNIPHASRHRQKNRNKEWSHYSLKTLKRICILNKHLDEYILTTEHRWFIEDWSGGQWDQCLQLRHSPGSPGPVCPHLCLQKGHSVHRIISEETDLRQERDQGTGLPPLLRCQSAVLPSGLASVLLLFGAWREALQTPVLCERACLQPWNFKWHINDEL